LKTIIDEVKEKNSCIMRDKMFFTYSLQMIKLTRAHIGIAVLPSFWLGLIFALLLGNEFNLFIFSIGFIIIFCLYASASYVNDYFDFEADKYNRQFGFSGGSGVLQKFPELKKPAKWIGIIFILISLSLTVLLSLISFIPMWAVGYIAIGAFLSYFYSAPPVQMAYRGVGEFPHFIAGLLNAGWGYLLITGTIDLSLILFAIPLSLHLLTVILLFEIPDKEADIHGGKQNFIVTYGRKKAYFLIMILFWLATFYLLFLAWFGWNQASINFWIPASFSFIPSIVSTYYFITKYHEQIVTKIAIKTALSLFLFSSLFLIYTLYLLF
jgi:1,4-dihydroxy-2-naphthoate octaprenyltransferase